MLTVHGQVRRRLHLAGRIGSSTRVDSRVLWICGLDQQQCVVVLLNHLRGTQYQPSRFEHFYEVSPSVTFTWKSEDGGIIWPSRIHWTMGMGLPVTRVRNWAGLPSTTLTSSSGVSEGGTSSEPGAIHTDNSKNPLKKSSLSNVTKDLNLLPMTWRLASHWSCPWLLLATQRYRPSSSGKASEMRKMWMSLPSCDMMKYRDGLICWPSFSHVIWGTAIDYIQLVSRSHEQKTQIVSLRFWLRFI